jgi:hypothetical protein
MFAETYIAKTIECAQDAIASYVRYFFAAYSHQTRLSR